ncbi:ankyrin repeat domain protein [Nitzschia inconspicua]|uniref:Ankyrin repeat domain protein n=1 Tax=Nitzschia inconspicua TaxID=303405 RepID=A0A9K3LQD3_9STRA|nr:ankyrin repeat domain protein [Nitzschia inconspicua]
MNASNAASGIYKSSSSSTTLEDSSDKKSMVRRSSTTDTSASNDSLSVTTTGDRGSNLSLHKSHSGSNSNPLAIPSSSPSPPTAAAAAVASAITTTTAPYLECDYDLNPTVLYQAIEAKQWEYALSIFAKNEQDDQSSTWVVRKETNGKLRWRLLPLHAAVIFGSPLSLIELLLTDHPAAAQSKDDQGMLPLHLAFRNESQWDVIEELLTAYPAAAFISDRKGRTPLQCGIRAGNSSSSHHYSSAASVATVSTTGNSKIIIGSSATASQPHKKSNLNNSVAMTISRTNTGLSDSGTVAPVTMAGATVPPPHHYHHKAMFRSVVNVLDVYSQIAVSGERKRAEQEACTLAKSSITQLKDSHMKTLAALKAEWEKQQAESQRQKQELMQQNATLEQRVQLLEQQLEQKSKEERRLQARYRRLEVALEDAEERHNENNAKFQMTLPAMQERMREVLDHVKEIVAERDQIRSMFLKDHPLIADEQQGKELSMIEDLEQMLRIERPTAHHGDADEKKVDDTPMSSNN